MNDAIQYADLWALLRELGFDCDTLDDRNHRICDFPPTRTRIVLHDYPPATMVHPQILIGVRLQLDNGGVMSREEFDKWAKSTKKSNSSNSENGSKSRRVRSETH